MSEIWAAAVAVGTAAYGAYEQGQAGKDARRGADAATQVQWDMYQQQREDQMPWLEAGRRGLTQLEDLNRGDYSSFIESPDYQYALDQGIKGLDRSAASRGTQYSGGQLAALADYSSGLATQNYNNYYNRISNLAGVGQTTATNLGNAATNYGTNAGNLALTRGQIDAASRYGTASSYGDAANAFAQLGGDIYDWNKKRVK